MPKTKKPRSGSMQFWPRVRSRTNYPRIRNWLASKEPKPLGFAGYKVGMTHLLINDNRQHSLTKGTDIFCPTTIVECPPIKTASIRFYKKDPKHTKLVAETFANSLDKELERKITIPKNEEKGTTDFDFIRLLCYTQPKLTNIGKKKPEIFEIAVGGNKEEQLAYAKERLGKEIDVSEVFKDGQWLDVHSLTKGKGFQGPMKRFGIQLRSHKSEKSRRNPGSLGPWKAQGHVMWRVAHAGKTGHNLRTEYNKLAIKIGNKSSDIKIKGDLLHYGIVNNPYILIKGSIAGHQKSLIRFTEATRLKHDIIEAPEITYTSLESKQGR